MSPKPRFIPRHWILAIELELGVDEQGKNAARVVISVPGRDGTIERVWKQKESGIDSDVWADMYHWTLVGMRSALACQMGIQEVLLDDE